MKDMLIFSKRSRYVTSHLAQLTSIAHVTSATAIETPDAFAIATVVEGELRALPRALPARSNPSLQQRDDDGEHDDATDENLAETVKRDGKKKFHPI